MAPSLGIPPHRHYDPSDLQDAGLRLGWAKFLFRAGYRLRYPQASDTFSPILQYAGWIGSTAAAQCFCRAGLDWIFGLACCVTSVEREI